MMHQVMSDRSLIRIRVTVQEPPVIHLLFADDSLFFSLANPKSGHRLKKIFQTYKEISRQAINLSKSSITFGSNVALEVKTKVRNILGIHNDGGIGKYLGLPENVGSEKKKCLITSLRRLRR